LPGKPTTTSSSPPVSALPSRQRSREIIGSKNTANLTAQAEEMVASQVHGWQEVKPQVTSLLNSNEGWRNALQQAASTGSAANVAGVLSSAASTVQANRVTSRHMKLAAQGLIGGHVP
jgi:hypothetical protein